MNIPRSSPTFWLLCYHNDKGRANLILTKSADATLTLAGKGPILFHFVYAIREEFTMKICRVISSKGEVLLGAYDPSNSGEITVMEGDLFGKLHPTDRREKIQDFLPPVAPPVVFALGLNYGKHAAETGIQIPVIPVVFMKALTSVTGHGQPVLLPLAGPEKSRLRRGTGNRHREEREEYPAVGCHGLRPGLHMRQRRQREGLADGQGVWTRKGQWARGKSFDTFCPLGPALVTKDDGPLPQQSRPAYPPQRPGRPGDPHGPI